MKEREKRRNYEWGLVIAGVSSCCYGPFHGMIIHKFILCFEHSMKRLIGIKNNLTVLKS